MPMQPVLFDIYAKAHNWNWEPLTIPVVLTDPPDDITLPATLSDGQWFWLDWG